MDKPWSELSARERDARVARALGWVDFWEGEGFIMAYPPNEQAMGIEAERVPIPPFTTDHNAAQQAISGVERRGLIEAYLKALIDVVGLGMKAFNSSIEVDPYQDLPDIPNNTFEWDGHAFLWLLISASPDNRCEAAVKVLEAQPNA